MLFTKSDEGVSPLIYTKFVIITKERNPIIIINIFLHYISNTMNNNNNNVMKLCKKLYTIAKTDL